MCKCVCVCVCVRAHVCDLIQQLRSEEECDLAGTGMCDSGVCMCVCLIQFSSCAVKENVVWLVPVYVYMCVIQFSSCAAVPS
jgi:hypothetical protein